jgi:hypothetical protein
MCQNDERPVDQLSLNNVISRWSDLVTNKMVQLTVSFNGEKQNYDVFVFGDQMDPDASNLPVDIQNAVINAEPELNLRAGEDV